MLSVGIASTGVLTFAFFTAASHVLDASALGAVNLLWTILFITISVIYRPVEQLLSRTISARRSQGLHGSHPLRQAALIQMGFAAGFLVVALTFRRPIVDAFDGRSALFAVLVVAALAYAGSYFARGYLAGHQWFGLYGGLVLFESVTRFCFPVAVAVFGGGQTLVATGIAAAPLASLLVLPAASRRVDRPAASTVAVPDSASEAAGDGLTFALAVAAAQIAEQTLLNAGPMFTSTGSAFAVVFGAFLIARAPLQLFQAVQTSLLPHLTALHTTGASADLGRALRMTFLAIGAFAALVTAGLLVIGPPVMKIVYPTGATYGRLGLAAIGVAMGLHLAAGALNQAALARGLARRASAAWAASGVAFLAWMWLSPFRSVLSDAESGYLAACLILCCGLGAIHRRSHLAPPT